MVSKLETDLWMFIYLLLEKVNIYISMYFSLCAELYEIFLSRAKEKWRSYSETSSVNDSESGKRKHQSEPLNSQKRLKY